MKRKIFVPYQPTPLGSYGSYQGQAAYTATYGGYTQAQSITCQQCAYTVNTWYGHGLCTTATIASSTVPEWMVQVTGYSYGQPNTFAAPTPDEETLAQWKREAEERHVKIQAAASRAEELLFMFIGEDRKKQYAEFGHFDVPVNGRVYRIRKGRSNNVLLLENGVPKVRYCAHPSDAVPDGDTMLAQFLMLTSDEKRFLEIANKSPCDGAYTPAAIPSIVDPAGLGPEIVPDVMAYMEERAFA